MVLKRPFSDEQSYSCKLPRQLECSNQMTSSVDIIPSCDIPPKTNVSSEGGSGQSEFEAGFLNGNVTEHAVGADKEFGSSAHVSTSSLSWASSSPSEDDSYKSDAGIHLSFFPGFFEHGQPTRTLADNKEIYSSLVDSPPRRMVSLGTNHQADVPIWGLQGIKNAAPDISDPNTVSQPSFPSCLLVDGDVSELMGTCVFPLPDCKAYFPCGVGNGRVDCNCQDEGSLRCVRQHILESREKLRENLGHETFVDLGFCDMGEGVAKNWSEQEERVFHEVVFSYPASMGKNFWNHLSGVFPARTRKELVSYYFNVFILRKRGVQNRLDPLNIDSDNDEWQGSENGDDEFESSEDEDSVVESPVDQEDLVYSEEQRGHFGKDDGEDESETENYNVTEGKIAARENFERLDKALEDCTSKTLGDCRSDLAHGQNCEEDNDLQDDSCTSYECQHSRENLSDPAVVTEKQECRVESDHSKQFQSNYDGMGVMGNLGYDEFCDARVWDAEYLSGPKTDIDFLPTCNMIKEVFGDEAWNSKGKDNKSIS